MLANLIRKLGDRYPTPAEKQAIREYLESVPPRRAALEELRGVARPVAELVVERARETYPQFERFHGRGFEKTLRDLGMGMAFCANSAFMGETDTIDDTWLFWFRTIMKAAHFTPGFMRDMFRWWSEAMQKHVSPGAFVYLKPVLDHMGRRLCDIPEPARAEIGERRADAGVTKPARPQPATAT